METAVLYGELKEEIHMETAVGYVECNYPYEIEEDEVFILHKGIYVLVQAAQQYIKSMEKFRYKLSKADPCFMYKKNKKGICVMSIYVDDNFLVGHNEALHVAIDQIKSTFNIKFKQKKLII